MRDGMGKRTWGRRAIAWVTSCALVCTHASGVLAQTEEERAGARAAATEGAQAFRDGKWVDAADLFTRAESLVHAPPHLIYLGRAQIHLGQWVKAQENFNRAARESLSQGSPKAFSEARAEAGRELKELEPRLPFVKVVVQGEGANLKVTMDGAVVPVALVGVLRPVDPGEHRFQASAEGMSSDVVTVTAKERTREVATVVLKPSAVAAIATSPLPQAGPALAGDAAGPAGSGASATGDPPEAVASPPASDQNPVAAPRRSGLRVISYVSLGVGALGFGVAGIFALQAAKKHSDADQLYDGYPCSVPGNCVGLRQQQILELDKQANDAKKGANFGVFLGTVGVLAGVTMFLLSSGGSEKTASAHATTVRPWVGPSSAGVTGTF